MLGKNARELRDALRKLEDSRQSEHALNGLNLSEDQFGRAIESGDWHAIQQAHKTREQVRATVESNFEEVKYGSHLKRWFFPRGANRRIVEVSNGIPDWLRTKIEKDEAVGIYNIGRPWED